MCGIVGAVAQRDVAEILLEGLARLEYRGYDSAGMATIDQLGQMQRLRRLGKVSELSAAYKRQALNGGTGIAHTRWATHGEPSEENAHPHISAGNRIAVVHNGIIENHQVLRQELQAAKVKFTSQTDSEVIAHLIERELKQNSHLLSAVQRVFQRLTGAYGAVIMDQQNPERLIAARSGSPMVIGLGIGENFIASDQLALLPVTRRFIILEEDEIAEITRREVHIYNHEGERIERSYLESNVDFDSGDKGQYRHHMLKEIFEQPLAISNTLEGRINEINVLSEAFGPNTQELLDEVEHIQIVACGTSYHAGMVARYWFEALAGIACNVEIASEFRYRKSFVNKNSLLVTISQSGETADTLAALRLAKQLGYLGSFALCNVASSSLVRESDLAFMTRAGTEVGVASTKAFTTQLVGLALLVIALGRKNQLDESQEQAMVKALANLPAQVDAVLELSAQIEQLAEEFADKNHALFLGRGDQYPIAMEGALKLKEISYIHAEAYAAGELKHGPLALIDAEMPIIVVAPNNELLEKLKSNVEEVRARGGILYVFADVNAHFQSDDTMRVINLPHVDNWIAPIVYTVPLQLLSYYVAIIKGTDVDQPRNLAKSVTVE